MIPRPLSLGLLLLLPLALPTPASARGEFDYDTACRRARAVPEPEDAFVDDGERERLSGCDSVALYYGLGQRRNVRDARLCALLEREDRYSSVLGGNAMLMVIYANGSGVARNLGYALRLACEDEGAPAELWHRAHHLWEMKRGQRGGVFDYCDDATSGFLDGACTERERRATVLERQRTLDAVARSFKGATRKAFLRLREAREAYKKSRLNHELDLSGTMRATIVMNEEDELDERFLAMLERLRAGEFAEPPPSEEPGALDHKLNETYQRVRQANPDIFEGIRATEKLWMKQRDAWLTFVALAFPKQSQDAVLMELLRERVPQLEAWQGS